MMIDIGHMKLNFRQPMRHVKSIFDQLTIPYVDPSQELSELGDDAFRPQDDHLSVRGHLAVASAMSESTVFRKILNSN